MNKYSTFFLWTLLVTHNTYASTHTKIKPQKYSASWQRKVYTGIESTFFGVGIALLGYGLVKKLDALRAIKKEHVHCDLRNAAYDLNPKKIDECLAQGIDVNATDREGNTALLIAIKQAPRDEKRCLDIVKKLCCAEVDLNSKNKEQRCALHYAVEAQATEIVRYLVSYCKLDIEAQDADGCTAFDMALELLEPPHTTCEIVGIIASYRLWQALNSNDYDRAENFIEHAHINAQDYQGNTLLLQACQAHAVGHDREKFIYLLAKHGADFELANIHGETPYLYALKHPQHNLATIVLESKKIRQAS